MDQHARSACPSEETRAGTGCPELGQELLISTTAPAADKALGHVFQLRQETCKVSGAEQTPSSLVSHVCFTRSRCDVVFSRGLRAGGGAAPGAPAQEAPSSPDLMGGTITPSLHPGTKHLPQRSFT